MKVIKLRNEYYLQEASSDDYVVIVHGMQETIRGYQKFINFLVSYNFNVVAYSQLGHGNCSSFGHYNKDDYLILIKDLLDIERYLKEQGAKNVYIIAHSMGTMVTRNAMKYHKFDKVVLNGMSGPQNKLYSSFMFKLFGMFNENKTTKIFNKIVFGNFNKNFKPVKTSFDWLSSNQDYVESYINDEKCGTDNTWGYYHEIIGLDLQLNLNEEKLTKLLLTSGNDDPVSNFGQTCIRESKKYLDRGFDVNVILYPGFRHFVFDEIDCENVYEDIVKFLQEVD